MDNNNMNSNDQNPYSQGNPYGQNPYDQSAQQFGNQDPYGQSINYQNQYNQSAQQFGNQDPYGQSMNYQNNNQSGQLYGNQDPYGQSMNYQNNINQGMPAPGMTYNDSFDSSNNNVTPNYGTYNSPVNYGGAVTDSSSNSGLGVAALILTILGCTSLIGLILAIVDLCKKDGKKKTLSVVALCISGVWLLISIAVFALNKRIIKKGDDTSISDTIEDNTSETTESTDYDDSNDTSSYDDSTDNSTDNSISDEDYSTTEDSSSSEAADYEASCEVLDYESVMRTPSDYEGKNVKVEGKVIQVQENEGIFSDDVDVVLRVAENGNSDAVWYITYKRTDSNEGRILEDDYITVYGVCNGITSYTALLGNEVTIPTAEAKYVVNGKVDEAGNVSAFDAQAIADNLNIVDYSTSDDYSRHYYLVIENTSDYDINLDVSVNYYDESEKLIGTDTNSASAVSVGNKAILAFWPDENTSSVQYKVTVSMCDYYKPVPDDVTYEVSETDEKIIVTAKNVSDETIDSVEGSALFFKDGNVVGYDSAYFTDSDYELKAGDEISKELNCYSPYDSYEFYIHPRKSTY